mgnify:FL=1
MKYITGIYIYICLVLGSMINSIVNLYPKNKIKKRGKKNAWFIKTTRGLKRD